MTKKEDEFSFLRKRVGLDLLGFEELLDRIVEMRNDASYPPYNIVKITEEKLIISIALAGFEPHELELKLDGIKLTVTGKKNEQEECTYVYKGIAARSFSKSFLLSDGIEIQNASFVNGLLNIELYKHITKNKTKDIPINVFK